MTARKLLISFLASLLPLAATAKDYPLHLSICEQDSSCSNCLEELRVTLSVDPTVRAVFLSAKTPEGAPVKEQLSDCKVTSVNDWECGGSDFRGQISATNGKLLYKPFRPKFEIEKQKLELCIR